MIKTKKDYEEIIGKPAQRLADALQKEELKQSKCPHCTFPMEKLLDDVYQCTVCGWREGMV